MVQTWQTGSGSDHKCPHCSVVYQVTILRLPARDQDSANCDVCGKVMAEWNNTAVPSFKLKQSNG
jgi:phage FluMu protein Com